MGLYEQNKQREHFADLYAKQQSEERDRKVREKSKNLALAKAKAKKELEASSQNSKSESVELNGNLGREIMAEQPQTIHPESKSLKSVAIPVKVKQQSTGERKPWDVDTSLFKRKPDPNATQGTLARYYQHRSM